MDSQLSGLNQELSLLSEEDFFSLEPGNHDFPFYNERRSRPPVDIQVDPDAAVFINSLTPGELTALNAADFLTMDPRPVERNEDELTRRYAISNLDVTLATDQDLESLGPVLSNHGFEDSNIMEAYGVPESSFAVSSDLPLEVLSEIDGGSKTAVFSMVNEHHLASITSFLDSGVSVIFRHNETFSLPGTLVRKTPNVYDGSQVVHLEPGGTVLLVPPNDEFHEKLTLLDGYFIPNFRRSRRLPRSFVRVAPKVKKNNRLIIEQVSEKGYLDRCMDPRPGRKCDPITVELPVAFIDLYPDSTDYFDRVFSGCPPDKLFFDEVFGWCAI